MTFLYQKGPLDTEAISSLYPKRTLLVPHVQNVLRIKLVDDFQLLSPGIDVCFNSCACRVRINREDIKVISVVECDIIY